jgi:pimeloyl-ACP methyl ester carboxylesterase/DNA-binding winged helix-turn-helix (wHTH) protein
MLVRFGNCEINGERRELRRGAALVHVQPQVFDLIVYLITHRERVISRDEMVEAVWGGRIVSDVTLNSRINAARQATGDDGKRQALIRTVPRRGFRFVGEVTEVAAARGETTEIPRGELSVETDTRLIERSQDVTFCRSSDGVNIAIATCGSGFPVVKTGTWLTHVQRDWDSPVWSPLFHRLAERFRLVRYDPRGCGLSDRDTALISFEGFVSDLEAVTDALRLERFALLGISQGAAVSIAYAAQHPDRVSHLILSGGFALGWNRRGTAAEIATRAALLTLIAQGWGQDNPAFRQVFAMRLWPETTAEQLKSFDELQRLSASPENAERIQRVVGNIDVTGLLPLVKAPTLVLHSRGDATVPRELGLMLAQRIPNARFVEFDSRNHFPLSHEPAWKMYVDEIIGFVGRQDSSRLTSAPTTPINRGNWRLASQ